MTSLRRSVAHTIALSAGSAVVGMGAVVLAGWIARSEALVRFGTGAVPTVPATALGFLLLGAAASFLALGARRAPAWLWAPMLAISAITLLEHGLGAGRRADGWFATSLVGQISGLSSRMSLPAAASMACGSLAFALLRLPASARRSTVAAFLGAVPLAVGGFGIFEYALDSGWVYAWTQAMRLALPTAIGCVILGAALVSLAWTRSAGTDALPRWLPAWAPLMLVVTALALAQAVRDREVEHGRLRAALAAADLGASVSREISAIMDAHELMAARIAAGEVGATCHTDAHLYLRQSHDPYASIYVLDGAMVPTAVEPAPPGLLPSKVAILSEPAIRLALDQARVGRGAVVSTRIDVAPGVPGFAIATPIPSESGVTGYLLASFDYAPVFARVVMPSPYQVSVATDGVPIYRSPEWDGTSQGLTRLDICGMSWDMEVAPGAELRGWQASSLPAAVLAFGLLLSAAIGSLAALMRRVGSQKALALEAQDRLAAEVDRRAQTEVQLGRTLTFLHCVLDSTSFSVIGTDLDGIIRTFNRSAERMLGYSAEELIGSATPLVIHDPNELAHRAVQLSIELERPVAPGFSNASWRMPRRNGCWRTRAGLWWADRIPRSRDRTRQTRSSSRMPRSWTPGSPSTSSTRPQSSATGGSASSPRRWATTASRSRSRTSRGGRNSTRSWRHTSRICGSRGTGSTSSRNSYRRRPPS